MARNTARDGDKSFTNLLDQLAKSPSKTLVALELQRNRSGTKAAFKYYLDGKDVTYSVKAALGVSDGPSSLTGRFGSTASVTQRWSITTDSGVAGLLREKLQALGADPNSVQVQQSRLLKLEKGQKVEGFAIENHPVVGSPGAALQRMTVLDKNGQAYSVLDGGFSSKADALQREQLSTQAPVHVELTRPNRGAVQLRFGPELNKTAGLSL